MARVLILVLTVMLVLSTKRAYSGGTDPIALRVLRDLQAQNELTETVQASLVQIHSQVINGQIVPTLRITADYAYAKPRRLRISLLKIESYAPPDFIERLDVSDEAKPRVMLFTEKGTITYDPATGEVLERLPDLPADMLYYFNRTTGLMAALPFHDITVVGRFVQDGREHVALRIVPHANAGSKALTSRDLTLTIDDVRHVIVKAEELITDTNEEGKQFDDLPRVAVSQFVAIEGIPALSHHEEIWDERVTYGSHPEVPPSQAVSHSFVPYLHQVEDSYDNLILNAAVSPTIFLAPSHP